MLHGTSGLTPLLIKRLKGMANKLQEISDNKKMFSKLNQYLDKKC